MTLKELEKQIQEKEDELEELKQRRLFMVPSQKNRIFSGKSVKNLFWKHDVSGFNNELNEELKKEAIRRATGNRTESLKNVTIDEYLLLKDAYMNAARDKIKELEEEKERKEKEELEKKRAYQEKYKDLIELDEEINKVSMKVFMLDGEKDLFAKLDLLRTKKENLMKEMNVKADFFGRYEPV